MLGEMAKTDGIRSCLIQFAQSEKHTVHENHRGVQGHVPPNLFFKILN